MDKRYFVYYQTSNRFPADLKFLRRTMARSRKEAVTESRQYLKGKRATIICVLTQTEVDKMRGHKPHPLTMPPRRR